MFAKRVWSAELAIRLAETGLHGTRNFKIWPSESICCDVLVWIGVVVVGRSFCVGPASRGSCFRPGDGGAFESPTFKTQPTKDVNPINCSVVTAKRTKGQGYNVAYN
jgi:hypothetical protein